MPNGSELTEAEFKELEQPLRRIDALVERFADQVGGVVERNYHGSPSRNVIHSSPDGTKRKIQVSPFGEGPNRGYVIAAMAWKDTAAGRVSWHKTIASFEEIPAKENDVWAVLEAAWEALATVGPEDLK
jgi:hypothetical protein